MLKNSKQITNYRFFVILACMTCFFYNSCEKTGYQTDDSRILNEKRIMPRDIDDCDECPVNYCCCAIELAEGQLETTLIFCGVYDVDPTPTSCGTASPPSPCASISGSIKTIVLNSNDPKELFCVPFGGSFSIYNASGGDRDIWFTCQPELTFPDSEELTILDEETLFFDTDGSCFLTGCPN